MRVPCANLSNTVFSHEYCSVNIMQDAATQSGNFGEGLLQDFLMSTSLNQQAKCRRRENRIYERPRSAHFPR